MPPPAAGASGEGRLADRSQDVGQEPRVALQELDPLALEALDQRGVVGGSPGPLVQASRLEELRLVDAWERARHLVAEVGIRLPGDGAFRDRLDDGAGILDLHLPRGWLIR